MQHRSRSQTSRALLLRAWGRLPARSQELLVRLATLRVTLGVCAVIVDTRGRVLLVRHTYRRPAWGLPGGFVGRHEQPDAALARELREELGLSATIGPLLHAENDARRRHLTLYYRAGIAGVPRHGAETDAHCYAAPNELPELTGLPLWPWLQAAVASDPLHAHPHNRREEPSTFGTTT